MMTALHIFPDATYKPMQLIFKNHTAFPQSQYMGLGTWKRSWHNYDINMHSWDNENKSSFLKYWIPSKKRHRKGTREMFDLHCNNNDPWTWDYQWVYSCWRVNALAIMPAGNLVSNIGIGPDASNTKSKTSIDMFPK